MGREWYEEGTEHDPKHSISFVRYSEGSVMAWPGMAASGNGSLFM